MTLDQKRVLDELAQALRDFYASMGYTPGVPDVPSDIQNEHGQAEGPTNYPAALERCLAGARIARSGWNGKGQWVACARLMETDRILLSGLVGEKGPLMRDFFVIRTSDGSLVPWLCSQTDALATDWYVLGGQA